MSRADHILLRLWIALTAAALIPMFAGIVLILLFVTVIGIPIAILLFFIPGLWLYVTPPLAAYAIARWATKRAKPAWIAIITAAVLVLAVGIFVPILANVETERRVAALLEQDGGIAGKLPPGVSVARLVDRGLMATREECGEDCQRLLLSKTASSYLNAPRDEFGRLDRLARPVLRFRLGPQDGRCRNDLLDSARASDEEVGALHPKPFLSEKLDDIGLCLHAEPTSDARADFVVVETWNFDRNSPSSAQSNLYLHPIRPFRRWEAYRLTNGRLVPVMRRTFVEYYPLAVPLWLFPPFPGFLAANNLGAELATSERRSSGKEIKTYSLVRWEPWITNDIGVRGLRRR